MTWKKWAYVFGDILCLFCMLAMPNWKIDSRIKIFIIFVLCLIFTVINRKARLSILLKQKKDIPAIKKLLILTAIIIGSLSGIILAICNIGI